MFTIDADDFCETNTDWDRLASIKRRNPDFRITLFTVPGLCSTDFISRMMEYEWLELAPHGWLHKTARECEHWTLNEARRCLELVEPFGMARIFKAPGWQISDDTYRALIEFGYTVADQSYNDGRRPSELKSYILGPQSIHGHIGHMGGRNDNALEFIEPTLLSVECETVGEYLKRTG